MNIQEEIREVAVSKNVNFLIGSGCSVGAIGTMGKYWEDAWKEKNLNEDGTEKSPTCCKNKEYCEACQKRGNELLVIDVKKVSKELVEGKLEENFVTKNYNFFISEVVNLMHRMNSRQNPKNINIFTTNYDLFIEDALDKVSKTETFVINDGARGYFKRILDSSNFNRTVSYRGPSNNYIDEIPSISLIKPHGSVNWEKTADEEIEIRAEVVDNPIVVNPDGHEPRVTFEENYFHDMLRIFQTELDKPQSVLFVIGFSFQDEHIAKMMQRALRNKELNVYVFCYSNNTEGTIRENLKCGSSNIKNLKFIRPGDIQSDGPMEKQTSGLTLGVVTNILKSGGN
ncbi:hypothetical protein HMPREF2527_03395 [Rothia sp. HMSC071B01]|jgi:hypothetical protein|uniref:SIR2 family protein n=1 Tax=Rothia TaxID=32207 RepID=UPI0008A43BE3|nr:MULTISPECIES: SIR2 family protein [Rothia]OFN74662.1 hypothetical protein HMPREF2527_03395 [Rothia sp. HMSC071B01]